LRLSQAIDSISYGRLEKVYVTFPRAFWHCDRRVTNPVTSEAEDTNDTNKFYERPTFVHFMDPTYFDHPKDIIWNQDCLSLAVLPSHYVHPTLLFYTNGPCGAHIISKISNLDPSSKEYYNALDGVFQPFYSRLHGYSDASPDCKPVTFLATQWQNDPYAGNGSYSGFQLGLEQGDKDIEAFRIGMGAERGVWFAGEHTAPFVALGTTTGAYWSGERAAKQILEAYGLRKSEEDKAEEKNDSFPCSIV
jgi:hypothetical protein